MTTPESPYEQSLIEVLNKIGDIAIALTIDLPDEDRAITMDGVLHRLKQVEEAIEQRDLQSIPRVTAGMLRDSAFQQADLKREEFVIWHSKDQYAGFNRQQTTDIIRGAAKVYRDGFLDGVKWLCDTGNVGVQWTGDFR